MVTASQQFISFGPATDVYNFGYEGSGGIDTWCTSTSDPDSYVDMALRSPVLITQILSSGSSSGSSSYYVTNFTLEYSPPNNITVLNHYTTETGDIKVKLLSILTSLAN